MEDILEDLSFVLCFEIRIGKTLRCLSLSYLYLYYTLLLYLLNVFLRLFLKNAMFGNELKHLSLWCCWWKEAFCCQLRSACEKKKKILGHQAEDSWTTYLYQFGSVAQSCSTLCDPMDYSPPGSFVHGILQARVGHHSLLQGIFPTEWLNLCLLHCRHILYCLNHQVSSVVVEGGIRCLEAGGIFLTQGLNQGLCTGRWILYHWSTRDGARVIFFALKEEYALRIVKIFTGNEKLSQT